MFAYYLHDLDPIIFRIYDNVGPRWYGLAYVLAFICSYVLLRVLAKTGYADLSVEKVGDFITGCALFGVIIGGSRCRSCGCGKAECRATAGCLGCCSSPFTFLIGTKSRG